MIRTLLCVGTALVLSACSHTGQRLPDNQRLLIVCEGWASAFRRVDVRDSLNMATERERNAVDEALPILNPICTAPPGDAPAFDIILLETALLKVIAAKDDKS